MLTALGMEAGLAPISMGPLSARNVVGSQIRMWGNSGSG